MAKPKPEKKPADAAPATRRILAMDLQLGDRIVDETGEYEVVGRPYTTTAGKNAHVRVRRGRQRRGHDDPVVQRAPAHQCEARERRGGQSRPTPRVTTSAERPASGPGAGRTLPSRRQRPTHQDRRRDPRNVWPEGSRRLERGGRLHRSSYRVSRPPHFQPTSPARSGGHEAPGHTRPWSTRRIRVLHVRAGCVG
jgi:hypothetical protein